MRRTREVLIAILVFVILLRLIVWALTPIIPTLIVLIVILSIFGALLYRTFYF